jgi:hypothetical protein
MSAARHFPHLVSALLWFVSISGGAIRRAAAKLGRREAIGAITKQNRYLAR